MHGVPIPSNSLWSPGSTTPDAPVCTMSPPAPWHSFLSCCYLLKSCLSFKIPLYVKTLLLRRLPQAQPVTPALASCPAHAPFCHGTYCSRNDHVRLRVLHRLARGQATSHLCVPTSQLTTSLVTCLLSQVTRNLQK